MEIIMYCNFIDTGKKFGVTKIYKCTYCDIELALEDENTKMLCFKARIDIHKALLEKSLKEHPIFTGTDFGDDTDLAIAAGFYSRGDIDRYAADVNKTSKAEQPEIKPTQQAPPKPELCSKEQIDKRLEICNSCEYYQEDACILCGCRIVREKNHQNKLANKNASCPANKWGPVN